MNRKSSISSRELKHSLWIIILLTLVFGFDDGNDTFILSQWSYNLLNVFILVSASIFANAIGAKICAMHLGTEAELGVLSINKSINILGFKAKSIPLASIFSLFLMLISKGAIYFTSIFTITTKEISFGRTMDESKEAFIYFWALASNVILVIIFEHFSIELGVLINTYIIIWNMLPIPGFLGSKILFNNKILYIFFFVFIVFFLLFAGKINIIILLIMASLIAFLAMIFWMFKREYKP